MTKEETKKAIQVMQAYVDGKQIEIKRINREYWNHISAPCWNWDENDYRVKPEKKMRPYQNVEEFLQAQEKHGMYIKIDDVHYVLPMNIVGNEVHLNCAHQMWSFKELVTKKWRDGTPCGIIEEE